MLSDLEDEEENDQHQQENGYPSSGMSDYSTTFQTQKKQIIWEVVTTLVTYIDKQSDIYPENKINGKEWKANKLFRK